MSFSYLREHRRPLAEAPKRSHKEELHRQQQSLGEHAFDEIQKAASENEVHGKQNLDAGSMEVSHTPHRNGYVVSVHVHASGTNDSHGRRGSRIYFVLEFRIYACDGRLYAHLSRFGPSERCSLENFDTLLNEACDYARNWRLDIE